MADQATSACRAEPDPTAADPPSLPPGCCDDRVNPPFAEKLRRRNARDREHLFVFITNRDVPATNNACERALRPSVIFRKMTNGFRSEWGAQTYAALRFVVSTAKANGRSVLGDLRSVLATASDRETIAPVG